MKSISGNASYIVNVSSRYIVNVSLIVHVNNEEGLIVTRYKCWGLVVRATRSLSKRYWESRITSWRTSTGSLTFFCNRSKHYRPNLTASWSPKWVDTSLHGWTCQVCLINPRKFDNPQGTTHWTTESWTTIEAKRSVGQLQSNRFHDRKSSVFNGFSNLR